MKKLVFTLFIFLISQSPALWAGETKTTASVNKVVLKKFPKQWVQVAKIENNNQFVLIKPCHSDIPSLDFIKEGKKTQLQINWGQETEKGQVTAFQEISPKKYLITFKIGSGKARQMEITYINPAKGIASWKTNIASKQRDSYLIDKNFLSQINRISEKDCN